MKFKAVVPVFNSAVQQHQIVVHKAEQVLQLLFF